MKKEFMEGKKQNDIEFIPLFRGGSVVSGLCDSFGRSLKETRLTAMLGYLLALNPESFLKILRFEGVISSISLESRHSEGRSDILIETSKGTGVIEAKINGTNPHKQSMKYPAKWRVLITQYVPTRQEKKLKNIHYLRWHDIGELLNKLSKSSNPKVKFISIELKNYLEEYHMIKNKESVEIYAREINGPASLILFLKSQLYGCDYEKNSRLPEALYFAPHFGQRIAKEYPGIHVGISYISQIETIETVETFEDLKKIIKEKKGKNWFNINQEILKTIHKEWEWKEKTRSFLFMGKPRLVFAPPIKKECLVAGTGFLSKRFFSFDELFAAWEGKNLNLK